MNVGISVSRVGGAAQIKAMKTVAGRLRLDLAQFKELEAFAQFGSDLDAATQRQLARGERTVEILKQCQYQPMPVENQVCAIYAVTQGHLDDIEVHHLKRWEGGFHEFLSSHDDDILAGIRQGGQLTAEITEKLVAAIAEYNEVFAAEMEAEEPAADTATAGASA
ncbi:MAG: hypothetical protein V3T24_05885 [Longimicrobiales bacterium]